MPIPLISETNPDREGGFQNGIKVKAGIVHPGLFHYLVSGYWVRVMTW